MNNLHRNLAPISGEAWADIEEEVVRTFKRNLSGRRFTDVEGPKGVKFTSVETGHLTTLKSPDSNLTIKQHEVIPLLQLRVPFELSRDEIDAVERGSNDSDWQPAKDAAKVLAFAEDRLVFEGFSAAKMKGLLDETSNPVLTLPTNASNYIDVVTRAVEQLKLEGVEGPYVAVMGAEPFTKVSEATESGYPVKKHIERLLGTDILWAPALSGACVISTRGGDFELSIGRDLSIGYASHTESKVTLYLEETVAFRVLSGEAVVMIKPAKSNKK